MVEERDQTIDQLRATIAVLEAERFRTEVSPSRLASIAKWAGTLILNVSLTAGTAYATTQATLDAAPRPVIELPGQPGDALRHTLDVCERVGALAMRATEHSSGANISGTGTLSGSGTASARTVEATAHIPEVGAAATEPEHVVVQPETATATAQASGATETQPKAGLDAVLLGENADVLLTEAGDPIGPEQEPSLRVTEGGARRLTEDDDTHAGDLFP